MRFVTDDVVLCVTVLLSVFMWCVVVVVVAMRIHMSESTRDALLATGDKFIIRERGEVELKVRFTRVSLVLVTSWPFVMIALENVMKVSNTIICVFLITCHIHSEQ